MNEKNNKDIPIFSLQRLPVYLNYLRNIPEGECLYVSSGMIARQLGYGEVLVRKDLAYTACAGKPKLGYVRKELIAALEEYLCCNNEKNAVVIGVGGLGKAILSYGGFSHYGIHIVSAFDSDPAKVGTSVADKSIYDISELKQRCLCQNVSLAILCVPAPYAQNVAESIIDAGVKGILNFAPTQLSVPEEVKVINIDVAANLAVLATML